jgi:tetratricopeptide (TPR) repeat protein
MSEPFPTSDDPNAVWQRHMEAGEQALRQGRASEAEQQYLDAVQLAERFELDDPRRVESLTRLGMLYTRLHIQPDERKQAVPPLTAALALREQALGPDHLEVARCLANLAQCFTGGLRPFGSRGAEAEPLLLRALAIQERATPPDLMLLHSTVNQLTTVYQRAGRESEAEAFLQRAAALWERLTGPAHPHALEPLAELGRLYQRQGRVTEAEAVLLQALAHQEQALGPEQAELGLLLQALVAFYRAERRYAEAEKYCRRHLAVSERSPNRDVSERAGDLAGLAALCLMQGNYAEAERLLTQAQALQGPARAHAVEPLPAGRIFAVLLQLSGRIGEAIAWEVQHGDEWSGPFDRGKEIRARVVAPPPTPDEQPEFVWISSLIVGHVRERSVEVRWQTTGGASLAFNHHSEGGDGTSAWGDNEPGPHDGAYSHSLQTSGLWGSIQVFAPARGRADMMSLCFIPARAPAPGGAPRLEVDSRVRLLGRPSFAEAEVRLTNVGDADALRVRIDPVSLPEGWVTLSQRVVSEPLPEPLDVGRIGAGGTGLLILRLCRCDGEAPPAVRVRGTYTDAGGTGRVF